MHPLLAMLLIAAPAEQRPLFDVSGLDLALSRLAEHGDFSGAVAIARHGRIIYSRGFGLANRDPPLPFRAETSSDGASLAKPVTAAAILLLAHEGKIDLDAPAHRYVPEYPDRHTTVRNLLTHSGGLPDYDSLQSLLDSGEPVATADLLVALAGRHTAPAFTPGSSFSYCNLCYDTLALVVERVTGESYEGFVRRRLLTRAGANDVFVRPARFANWRGVRTRGYRHGSIGWSANDAFDNEAFYGGGNLYFSATSLVRWASGWADGGEPFAAIRAMATATVILPEGRSALSLGNWYCAAQATRCYYRGHHQGFDGVAYWDRTQGLAVAFLSNSSLNPPLQYLLPRMLVETIDGRAASQPEPPAVQPTLDPASLLGTYDFGNGGRTRITLVGAHAAIQPPGGVRYLLFKVGGGWFYAPGLDAYLARPQRGTDQLLWASVFGDAIGRKVD